MSYLRHDCFTIMGFHPDYKDLYTHGIKRAVEELGFNCERADERYQGGDVHQKIVKAIKDAYFVVVDLSAYPSSVVAGDGGAGVSQDLPRHSPNCFYELGMARALKPTENIILICNRTTPPPFDVQSFEIVFYDPCDWRTPSVAKTFRLKLQDAIVQSVLQANKEKAFEGFSTSSMDPERKFLFTAFIRNIRRPCLNTLLARFPGGLILQAISTVHFQVASLAPRPSIAGPVMFHLHPSFGPQPRPARNKNGVATYDLTRVAGEFTAAVEIGAPAPIKLSLDLNRIPNGPPSFYSNPAEVSD